ncbi:DEK C-terminal domain-containing protein [Heracleum sosnowskyi]|uniref:DEK C-terminal domain-containing protein n=1 Tax=Heracleum sosnowskyi TaxID=360622 RepID=A0AAD8J3T0_9APIA|nr:DEK C-terminal domain-containing protein [Heracleum sosnowskyi]
MPRSIRLSPKFTGVVRNGQGRVWELEKDDAEEEIRELEKDDSESKEKKLDEEPSSEALKQENGDKKTVEKKKEEPKTPVAPASDRPVRERKSVERLVATIDKDSGKDFQIEKGRGTALKDIPNVAYKLSRKKSEERDQNYLMAAEVKSNISQFSGFVWHDNEDKHKNRIKEKLDKCVKEKLLEFCEVLDLPVSRATTKKEDIVTKLFDFLEAPQASTSELLADEELTSKGNKRKRSSQKSTSTSGSAPSKSSAKSRQRNASKGEEKKDTPEMDSDQEEQDEDVHGEQENVDGSSDGSEDEKTEGAKSEEKETDTGAESGEETKKRKRVSSKKSSVKKNSPKKATPKKATIVKKSSPPPKKAPLRPSFSRTMVQDSDTSPKIFTRKKTEAVKEKSPTPKKSASKDIAGKKVLKGKEEKLKVEKLKPSKAELKNATCEILREVDLNTATFTDVLNLLGKRFNTDLVPRKSTIKVMVQDELIKLVEEEDDEEDEEVKALKDGKQASGPDADEKVHH